MRNVSVVALFVLLVTSFSGGQKTRPSAPVPSAGIQQDRVKVYAIGPGVTAPELLPLGAPPIPVEKCKKSFNAYVLLSAIVDATGRPRNLMFLKPEGTDFDKFALQSVAADRFKPGIHDGSSVAVGVSVGVIMQACAQQIKDDAGKKTVVFRMRSEPVQKLGPLSESPEEATLASADFAQEKSVSNTSSAERIENHVTAPVVLNQPEAEYTKEARKARYSGICLISLIVDKNGMPQNLIVKKALDYGLSENALVAVSRYRFKPAMKDGEPVPVMMSVEVNFRLY